MFSTTAVTPRCSAIILPRRSESSDESRSGMNSPSTLSLPRARVHSVATTELSIPPDSPTTAPRRRQACMTCCRIACSISSATLVASMESTSFEKGMGGSLSNKRGDRPEARNPERGNPEAVDQVGQIRVAATYERAGSSRRPRSGTCLPCAPPARDARQEVAGCATVMGHGHDPDRVLLDQVCDGIR